MSEEEYTLVSAIQEAHKLLDDSMVFEVHCSDSYQKGMAKLSHALRLAEQARVMPAVPTHVWVVTLREEDEGEVTTTILGVFRTEPTDAMRCLRSGLSRGVAVVAERVELKP